jgi:hypothetical protein
MKILKNCLLLGLLMFPILSRAQQEGVYKAPVDKNYQVYVLSEDDHKTLEDLDTKLSKDIDQVTTDRAKLDEQKKALAYKYSKRIVNFNDYSSTYQYFGKYLIYCVDDYKCEGIPFNITFVTGQNWILNNNITTPSVINPVSINH